MKKISKLFYTSLLSVNFITIGGLILTAYSPYFNPESLPFLANLGLGFPILLLLQAVFLLFWLLVKPKQVKYSIIGLLIIAPQLFKYCPVNWTKPTPNEAIKVLSYNTMSFGGLTKNSNHKNEILEYLKDSQADIICLQEYSASSNSKYVTDQDINKALSTYNYSKINKIGNNKSGNKLAIYSKYPIKQTTILPLNSSYNGAVAYVLNVHGEDVLVINCHLESNKITKEDKVTYERILKMENKEQLVKDTKSLYSKFIDASLIRQKQAQKVDSIVKISKLPYKIVCGDFNDSPLSYTNRLLEENLTNAFVQSGTGFGISYNQNKFFFRIDNILVSKNIKAFNCIVDRSIKASDHYPIWCYIAK